MIFRMTMESMHGKCTQAQPRSRPTNKKDLVGWGKQSAVVDLPIRGSGGHSSAVVKQMPLHLSPVISRNHKLSPKYLWYLKHHVHEPDHVCTKQFELIRMYADQGLTHLYPY